MLSWRRSVFPLSEVIIFTVLYVIIIYVYGPCRQRAFIRCVPLRWWLKLVSNPWFSLTCPWCPRGLWRPRWTPPVSFHLWGQRSEVRLWDFPLAAVPIALLLAVYISLPSPFMSILSNMSETISSGSMSLFRVMSWMACGGRCTR